MIAIPAIDLREGACVQLVGGSYADERCDVDAKRQGEQDETTDSESGAEVWATDVPFGFVKTVDRKGNSMVLTGHGSDAVSAISGTPASIGG